MRVLDLCAGIGGFSLAATWAGYEIAGQVEIDPWCRRVLAKHWPDAVRLSDVFEVRGDEFGPVDLVCAGIPCQPYSVAGKRRGADDDRAIWPAVRAIIETVKPSRVLIENVAGFIGMALDGVSADLEDLGYACGAVVVPACAVGAPHRRDRVWILAESLADAERGGGREHVRIDAEQGALPASLWREGASGIRSGGQDVADAPRLSEREPANHPNAVAVERDAWQEPRSGGGREALSGVGDAPARVSRWVVGPGVANPWAGDWEAGCPRTMTHEVDRVHKLKALGNAIVPQVAYQILSMWEESA